MSKYFRDVDGVLYVTAVGGMTGWGIDNVAVAFIKQDNGAYVYTAAFDEVYVFDIDIDTTETKYEPRQSGFSVKRVGNDFKISSIEYLFTQ